MRLLHYAMAPAGCSLLLFVAVAFGGLFASSGAEPPQPAQPPQPPLAATSAPQTNNLNPLINLSLEQLMNEPVQASGTLTPTPLKSVPVALTVITAQDIRLTPHRNLLDLLEIYVPGSLVMTHSEGMLLGMRGIISDRNLKFLLLVNGREIMQTAHNGAGADLANWDLEDIERIEVIRGPGSVTYGPGAIAGVVNIITKTADQVQSPEVTLKYTTEYGSKMVALSYGLKKPNVELFAHVGLAFTDGVDDIRAFSTSTDNQAGFVGTPAFPAGSTRADPPRPYLADFEAEPQGKAMLDFKLFQEWRLWGRFVSSGGNASYRSGLGQFQLGVDPAGNPILGERQPNDQLRLREGTVQLENSHEFSDWFTLDSSAGWASHDFLRRTGQPFHYTAAEAPPLEIQRQLADPDSIRNLDQNFSEDQLLLKELGRFQVTEETKAVLGAEFRRDHFGPAWLDNPANFRMGESSTMLPGPDSSAINPPGVTGFGGVSPSEAVFVGTDGWSTEMYSGLGELTFEQLSWLNVIVSGRVDKERDTDFLYSPRLAFISQLSQRDRLRLTLQQSVRAGTGEQLLVAHQAGQEVRPETLRAVEAAYQRLLTDQLSLAFTPFYNTLDTVGFSRDINQTTFLGTQQHFGLELEGKYTLDTLTVGLSHAYVKLLDWDLAPGITGSGVSYSDYGVTVQDSAGRPVVLTGTGNNLNNWANNITKFYFDYRFFKRFTLHNDLQVFWAYEGAEDQFAMLQRAAAGTASAAAVNSSVGTARSVGAFGPDLRFNAAITYDITRNLSFQVFVLNLFNTTNRRYDYESGTRALAPQVFFVEEPRAVGVVLHAKF